MHSVAHSSTCAGGYQIHRKFDMADDYGAQSSSSSDFQSSISKDGHEVFKRTRKRIPLMQRSLAVVLASLQGVQVVIELKNDNEITGTVDETDSNMNVTLQNVRQVCTITSPRCNRCCVLMQY